MIIACIYIKRVKFFAYACCILQTGEYLFELALFMCGIRFLFFSIVFSLLFFVSGRRDVTTRLFLSGIHLVLFGSLHRRLVLKSVTIRTYVLRVMSGYTAPDNIICVNGCVLLPHIISSAVYSRKSIRIFFFPRLT